MPFTERDGTELRGVLVEQQTDGHWFHVRRSFAYHDPILDKDVVVPQGLKTDLSSVPWFLWWLVASYGTHTAAALVHDYLVVENMTVPQRVEADAIFFHALEESGNNWFRHRIMFAAVSWGLSMRKGAPILFCVFVAQLALFWGTALWGVLGAIGWCDHGTAAGLVALIVGLAGFAWARVPTTARELAWWLWPASVAAVGVVAVPVLVIFPSVFAVYAIDLAAAIGQAVRGRGWVWPTPPWPRVAAKKHDS